MYIDHKGLEIPEIEVEANMFHRIEGNGVVLRIDRKIDIKNLGDPELKQRLTRVAEDCPVSKILKGNINIQTEFK
jgi:putative redox protein